MASLTHEELEMKYTLFLSYKLGLVISSEDYNTHKTCPARRSQRSEVRGEIHPTLIKS